MTSAWKSSARKEWHWRVMKAEHTVIKGTKSGFQTARPPYFFMQRYAPCYVEEVRQFIECVREGKPTPTTGKDGRMAVVLGFAAWKSLRENRPVNLSEFVAITQTLKVIAAQSAPTE